MRSSRISECVHEKELSVPRTLMTIHCLSARMVMVMLNFKAEHSAKKRRVCIIFLDQWVCQGHKVSRYPQIHRLFRMFFEWAIFWVSPISGESHFVQGLGSQEQNGLAFGSGAIESTVIGRIPTDLSYLLLMLCSFAP